MGRQWPLDTPDEFRRRMAAGKFVFRFLSRTIYEYMVFLRHYGFPSPLLDWSNSPYVAAFFAFRHASPAVDRVSIYAFLEYAGKGKSRDGNSPRITGMGPNVQGQKRHFLQQCQYTVCTKQDKDDIFFIPHPSTIANSGPEQDILWHFSLPASQKRAALKELEEYNLNAFSLFGSDDSLVETLGARGFILDDARE